MANVEEARDYYFTCFTGVAQKFLSKEYGSGHLIEVYSSKVQALKAMHPGDEVLMHFKLKPSILKLADSYKTWGCCESEILMSNLYAMYPLLSQLQEANELRKLHEMMDNPKKRGD